MSLVASWMGEGDPAGVALHGFTGDRRSYEPVLSGMPGRWWVPDLPGHGGSEPVPSTFEGWLEALEATIDRAFGPDRPWVVGYSMGGRLALGLVVRRPDRYRGLCLLGASAGLEDEPARVVRRKADARWIDLLTLGDLEAFVRAWEAQPVMAPAAAFAGAVIPAVRPSSTIRRSQDPRRLAQVLASAGLAEQPAYHGLLGTVTCPVVLAAGEFDPKFRALAASLAPLFPHARTHVIPGSGHDVLSDAPRAVGDLLAACLSPTFQEEPS
jgi:2-succinyl-6-hydroxy-2,4-cyclohexadiene-1-carboxylate synthase